MFKGQKGGMARTEEMKGRVEGEVKEISIDYCLSHILSGFFSSLELIVGYNHCTSQPLSVAIFSIDKVTFET